MNAIITECEQCGSEFKKLKKEIERSKTGMNFCSRSCSVTYNNIKNPKRKMTKKCNTCKCLLPFNRKYCDMCLPKYYDSLRVEKPEKLCKIKRNQPNICYKCSKPCWAKKCRDCLKPNYGKDITIEEAIYRRCHKSSAFALIRTRARAIAKVNGWNCCSECGYNKHFEVCHIKSISDFPEDTLISIVNHINNLKPLCPNCHWEFDN